MIPKDILDIILKYQSNIPEQISDINVAIDEIIYQLKTINKSLSKELLRLTDNDLIDCKENEILQDSQTLRKYINSINFIPIGENTDTEIAEELVSYFDGKVILYLVSDDICPFDGGKMNPHIIYYQRMDGNVIHNETVKWYRCPVCKKLFSLDIDANEFDFANTNIVLNKNYYDKIPDVSIYSVIILSNTVKCSSIHKTKDIIAKLPTISNEGNLDYCEVRASYCFECDRFTILKEEFKTIKNVVICKIIDETTESKSTSDNEIEIEQKKSVLYNYGYNVKSKANLSVKQRHIILSSVIEAGVLNRRQIIDHISRLIERGSKIPSWKDATDKWKEDRYFVQNYSTDNLPKIIFDKIVLRYKK